MHPPLTFKFDNRPAKMTIKRRATATARAFLAVFVPSPDGAIRRTQAEMCATLDGYAGDPRYLSAWLEAVAPAIGVEPGKIWTNKHVRE